MCRVIFKSNLTSLLLNPNSLEKKLNMVVLSIVGTGRSRTIEVLGEELQSARPDLKVIDKGLNVQLK